METSIDGLNAEFGDVWLPSRRFGVRQSGKTRCVDDLSAPLVNSAFGVSERVALGGVDEVAAAAKLLLTAGSESGVLHMELADGSTRSGIVHPAWRNHADRDHQGGALDVTSAYKQLAWRSTPSDAGLCVLVRRDTGGRRPRLLRSRALPFGASASVSFFNRVARSTWWLGIKLFG